jgi:hypothetical protein
LLYSRCYEINQEILTAYRPTQTRIPLHLFDGILLLLFAARVCCSDSDGVMKYRYRIPLLLLVIRWLEFGSNDLPSKPNEDFSENLNESPETEEDEPMLITDSQPSTLRVYDFVRTHDVSGVSGTGVVAQVVEFSNGRAVMNWTREPHATTVYLSLSDLLSVHGHGGASKLVQVFG